MPRLPRLDIPDTVYHVFTRGNNKGILFLDDKDRATFMKYLKRAQEKHPWQLLDFCLMDNHYHLEVKTLDNPLWKTMHYLNNLYAGYFNFRHDRVGHLFQGRFHSIPVQKDAYLLNLSRYIHLNPVAAGLVKKPEDYEWSSYRSYLPGAEPGLVQTELVLETLSENAATQRERYREFVEEEIGRPPKFTEELILKTRILGNDSFIRALYAKQPLAFPTHFLRRGDSPNGAM